MSKFGDGVFKKWDTERMVTTWTVVHNGRHLGELSSREEAKELFEILESGTGINPNLVAPPLEELLKGTEFEHLLELPK